MQQHGGMRVSGMPDTELVKHVGIRGSEVSDGVVAQQQPLEHRFVNDAAGQLFIGAHRLPAGGADGRRNQIAIDGIEVDDQTARVRLGAKRHEDEAQKPRWIGGHRRRGRLRQPSAR